MCGLSGFVGSFKPDLMARMNAVQRHRGPNGSGVFEDAAAGVALGHVRLAILDLSDRAAQPMYSADGRYVLVYNGEIYNFAALREELTGKGHAFTSTGDTEVLLCGLQEYGETFLPRLNGMFALALWDRHERRLLLARDQLGIKPLYYVQPHDGQLLFASELKALLLHPAVRREPDFDVLQQHLAFCHATDERTALKGIFRLPPGSLLRWDAATGRTTLHTYWQPAFPCDAVEDSGQAAQRLRELLEAAAARQMIADVPVGVLLSGGLDSSVITAFARSRATADFRCFTISYPASENAVDGFDLDAPHARRLARDFGLPLEEIEAKPQVASLWPELIYHLDEPIADPAAITAYLISRLAQERGTTVLLSGQGGDEVFCGYPRYVAWSATAWLQRLPSALRRVLASSSRFLPGSSEGKLGTRLRRIRRVVSALHEDSDERFLAYAASTPAAEIRRILNPDVRAALKEHHPAQACLARMHRRGLSGLERVQERDLSVYLPNHNLLYLDKMSMAVSRESRVPLLDLELLEAVFHYPRAWKLAGRTTKVLLRQAAQGVVPDEIIHRPKAGFGVPYRKWLCYDLKEMWQDVMSDTAVKRRGWFDPVALQEARQRSLKGEADLYMLQWAALTCELWARCFLDQTVAAEKLTEKSDGERGA